jgi:protein-tyrosine phosphatase
LERAVDAPRLPLLFHCAAGKDRTGLVAALLLGLLRVPHETIIEDYGLTTTYYTARRLDALADVLAEHKVAPDTVRAAIDARAEVLDGALRHLLQQWGTYDGYATECLGVAARLPEQLRAALTEPVESP